jgi:Mn2+/Fe2+ NRAMP family transporter
MRGRIGEAYQWNIYGMRVFLFFFLQLLMRVIFSVYYLKDIENRKWLIIFDIAGSVLIFALAFYPFFLQLFKSVIN